MLDKLSLISKNRVHSEETKEKIRQAGCGRKQSVDAREKLSSIDKDKALHIIGLLDQGFKTMHIARTLDLKPHIITDIKRGKTWQNLR